MQQQTFELGAILSITHRWLLVEDISRLYDLFEHLNGYRPMTHELSDLKAAAAEALFAQLPQLRDAVVEGINRENWLVKLVALEELYGTHHVITALPTEGRHESPEASWSRISGGKPSYTLDLTESDDDTP